MVSAKTRLRPLIFCGATLLALTALPAAAQEAQPSGNAAQSDFFKATADEQKTAAEVARTTPAPTLPSNTPKPVSEAQLQEFIQDFLDVDFDKNDEMDAQEVRAHFKTGISTMELYQFFLDSDKDASGTISLQEYVDYAAMLT
mmetsp:Transcript_16204/g.37278  ORF Transcript_16204/g.37278 Transcript_16204/m.37278 type:complete len:143 (+) Transcript_16204:110-538(+)